MDRHLCKSHLVNSITFLALVSPQAGVSSPDIADEADFLIEIPVIDSATRLNQKISQAPAAVTLITREMIAASGATEIPQLLNLVPGFSSYYVAGNQFGVTRGLGRRFPSDLEVLVDGRSVYESIYSTVEWSSLGISVHDIEYIEVVRGSNTPAYGSNAFLGAINIVTTSPVQAKGTKLRATWGEIHTRNAQLNHFGHVGDINYSININHRSNQGFPGQDNPTRAFERAPDDSESYHITSRAIYTPTLSDSIEIDLGYGKTESDIPRRIADDPIGFVNRELSNNYQRLRWSHQASEDQEVRFQLYHNHLNANQFRDLGVFSGLVGQISGLPQVAVQGFFAPFFADDNIVTGIEDGFSERYEFEGQHNFRINNHRIVWGGAARLDRLHASPQICDEGTVDEWLYRGFANWEWQVSDSLTSNTGVTAEKIAPIKSVFSPRFALNYQLNPNNTLRFSSTLGYRIPSVIETHLNECLQLRQSGETLVPITTASEDITAAKVKEFEVGYLGNFLNNSLSLELRAFVSEVKGEIDLVKASESDNLIDALLDFQGIPVNPFPPSLMLPTNFFDDLALDNAVNWRKKGLELSLNYRPDDRTLINLSYANTHTSGFRTVIQQPRQTTSITAHTPRNNLSLLLKRTLMPNLDLSLTWYHLSGFTPRSGQPVSGYDRVDARLAYAFQIGKNTANLELIGHNILDDSYIEFETFNVFERRVLVRVEVDFH